MKYYQIMPSGEYAKKKGKYGSVYDRNCAEQYFINDFSEFPKERVDSLHFKFESLYPDQTLADYPFVGYPNCRIVSHRMWAVLNEYMDPEMVYFHPISVKYKDENVLMFILHFYRKIDVLDKEKTEFLTDGYPWVPIVDEKKLEGIDIFLFHKGSSAFCISETICKIFKKMKVTGCYYQPLF